MMLALKVLGFCFFVSFFVICASGESTTETATTKAPTTPTVAAPSTTTTTTEIPITTTTQPKETEGPITTTTTTEAPTTQPSVTRGVSLTNVFLGIFFGMLLMFLLQQCYQWWYLKRQNNDTIRLY